MVNASRLKIDHYQRSEQMDISLKLLIRVIITLASPTGTTLLLP